MLKEKGDLLILNLNKLIKKYGNNDTVRNSIVSEFRSRNMKQSNAINILQEKLDLATLDIDMNSQLILLFFFTKGMYNALTSQNENNEPFGDASEYSSIIMEDYFTPVEIENLKDYKMEKTSVKKEVYVFKNMQKIAENHWVGIISAKQLYEIDLENEFIYNFATQRDPVIDVYGMKRIKLDKQKVKDIKERLLAGLQFPDEIRVNVLHDGTDQIEFDEKSGTLTIISGVKNIFDGFHRKTGNGEAFKENNDLDFNWGFAVTNFSEKKAQEYMVQINKQKPFVQEYIKTLDTSKLGNVVVDAIKDTDSEFALNIKDSDAELKHGGLTKKSILATSIEEVYEGKLENRIQAKGIAKHIAEFMDYIMGLNIEAFISNPEETRKTSFINHKNMFAGYVALSAKLYQDKDWEDKIEDILNQIDFSVDNSYWKGIGLKLTSNEDMNKATRKNLYDFFRNLAS